MSDPFSHLIPLPRRIHPLGGHFDWSPAVTVVLEPSNSDDAFAAGTLAAACALRGLEKPRIIEISEELTGLDRPMILAGDPCRHLPLLQAMQNAELEITPELGDEGYLLHITPDLVLIAGNTPAAVFYGFQTFIQLLPETGSAILPCVSIEDWPGLRQRGISMDFGRGEVYTQKAIEKEIERLAHYKMNVLLLYLEDAFEFPSHPDIGETRDRITPAMARRLDIFAKKHHILLIPCVDSPGHLERLLLHPNYAHLVEGTENPSLQMVIDVTHPETYPLLFELYGDLCDAFTSPFIHMGGDEAIALGKGKSKPVADRFGAARLFADHLKKLRTFLAERGRRIICWADPFEPDFFKPFGIENYGYQGLAYVPRDVLISSWHYGKMDEFSFGEKAVEMGFELQMMTSMGCHELYPGHEGAAANVESFIPYAYSLNAVGVVHTNWGDFNSFREYTWPVLGHFAEWAWTPDARPWAEILPIAAETFFGPDTGDVDAAIRCCGDAHAYFGWAIIGIGAPIKKIFFDPMEPFALDDQKKALLSSFQDRLKQARVTFDQARPNAVRETAMLDFCDFALDQFELLTVVVECRHRLAVEPDSARPLLERLSRELPPLLRRYEELWHRNRMPRGLEPNKAHFEGLIASVNKALG